MRSVNDHAAIHAMRPFRPCGDLCDHVIRGCQLLTTNTACLPCLVVRALSLQTDLIGETDFALVCNCFDLVPVKTTQLPQDATLPGQVSRVVIVTFAIGSSGGVVGYLTLQGNSYTIRYNPIPNVTKSTRQHFLRV